MCDEKLLCYNISVGNFNAAQEVKLDPRCFAFMVENIGTEIAFVEGKRLLPSPGAGAVGQNFSVSGNRMELYKGRLRINFAGGGVPLLEITQQFYIG